MRGVRTKSSEHFFTTSSLTDWRINFTIDTSAERPIRMLGVSIGTIERICGDVFSGGYMPRAGGKVGQGCSRQVKRPAHAHSVPRVCCGIRCSGAGHVELQRGQVGAAGNRGGAQRCNDVERCAGIGASTCRLAHTGRVWCGCTPPRPLFIWRLVPRIATVPPPTTM